MPRKCIIVDIDGTLSDPTHRRHFLEQNPPDWDSFLSACGEDDPNEDIVKLAQFLDHAQMKQEEWNWKQGEQPDFDILIVSGRGEEHREKTERWLDLHQVHYDELLMRPEGDYRSDVQIKQEILDNDIRGKGYEPIFAVDDRDRICDLWRRNGITCLQCADSSDFFARSKSPTLNILIGPSGAGKDHFIDSNGIDRSQVVSSDQVRAELSKDGDFKDQSRNDEVFHIFHELVAHRLKLGLDVWANATNLKRADRLKVAQNAHPNTTIRYVVIDRPMEDKVRDGGWRNEVRMKNGKTLIEYHEERFRNQLQDIESGDDGVADEIVFHLEEKASI